MPQKYSLFAWAAGAAAVGMLMTAGAAYATIPTFTQTSMTVGLGQSMSVTSQNGVAVYLELNSSPVIASVAVNGSQVTVTGLWLGSTSLTICAVGTASDCTNLGVIVQSASVSGISFNPSSVSLLVGGNQAVTVSGGNGTYNVSGNSNTTVASTSLSSSTLTVTGLAAGGATITVCDTGGACNTLPTTISSSGSSVTTTTTTSSASNQAVIFSIANPTLAVGQTLNVALSGSAAVSYVVLSNQNPNIVQANVVSNVTLALQGVSAGTGLVTVCATGGGCTPLTVVVTGSASTNTAPTPTTTTPTTVTTPTVPSVLPTVPLATTVANATLLAEIQALQSAVTQALAQIQSIQTQLNQLAAQVSGGSAGAAASASAGASNFTELLKVGSQDAQVTALQQRLAALGFYSGPITGFYGPLTAQAVMKYQSAHGISPTGYVGPSTQAALNTGN